MHEHFTEIDKLISAGVAVIWAVSHEERRFRALAKSLESERGFAVLSWDLLQGFKLLAGDDNASRSIASLDGSYDPVTALNKFSELDSIGYVLIMHDMHKFIDSIEIIRACKLFISSEQPQKHIIFISHESSIPSDLEKDVVLTRMSLPGENDINEALTSLLRANEMECDILPEHITAVLGLTQQELINALSLNLSEDGTLIRTKLEQFKLQAVKKSGLMEIFPAAELSELGGLNALKAYMQSRVKGFENPDLPTPAGILLMGLPGGGKSLSAKAIASILKMPLIKLDIASLKSKYVGESESKMGQALDLIDAVSPAVVWLDEIEKSVGGVLSSNSTDGGTSSAMFGKLLTWMQESKKPKFIVATCNDISPLLQASHGALLRRFDDIFFVDTPNDSEKAEILEIHNAKYNADVPESYVPKMLNWTGAEIEKLCKSSRFEGNEQAFAMIRPIYDQNKEAFEKMRAWASKNARPANETVIVAQQKRLTNASKERSAVSRKLAI